MSTPSTTILASLQRSHEIGVSTVYCVKHWVCSLVPQYLYGEGFGMSPRVGGDLFLVEPSGFPAATTAALVSGHSKYLVSGTLTAFLLHYCRCTTT